MISSDKGAVKLKGSEVDILTDYVLLTKTLLTEFDLDYVLTGVAVAIRHVDEPAEKVVDSSMLTTLLRHMKKDDDEEED